MNSGKAVLEEAVQSLFQVSSESLPSCKGLYPILDQFQDWRQNMTSILPFLSTVVMKAMDRPCLVS